MVDGNHSFGMITRENMESFANSLVEAQRRLFVDKRVNVVWVAKTKMKREYLK